MVLMFGLAGGSNILISQYWGKGDVKSIHKYWQQFIEHVL